MGKGGSGKTTISRLYIEYLAHKGEEVLALDADINIHLARKFGVIPQPERALSYPENKTRIKQFLLGTNTRIVSTDHMVKTTPPGTGSQCICLSPENYFIKHHTQKIHDHVHLGYVGTYEANEIGTSCYHTNLSIAENVLSHTITKANEWMVVDMVAGTDAFSCTLHMQFDAIVLVIEPTPDGVSVAKKYIELAQAAGVERHLICVGNKCLDKDDETYLRSEIGDRLITCFMQEPALRRLEQSGISCSYGLFGQEQSFLEIEIAAKAREWNRQEQLAVLYELHKKYVAQSYIVSEMGDISGQIDPEFRFGSVHV